MSLSLARISLTAALVRRDVLIRYRGAVFGLVWVLLYPLILLGAFSLIFDHVFHYRWSSAPGQSDQPYWISLYSGLIAFNIFSDTLSRSPGSIRSHPNFVKKIVFPVELLPVVPLGSALVHGMCGFLILLGAIGLWGSWHGTVLLYPMAILPIFLISLGLSWILATWGVFIKDMTQITPPLMQLVLFLSPVFYSMESAPASLRLFLMLNPVGTAIENGRNMVLGLSFSWALWAWSMLAGIALSIFGYRLLMASRDEFPDAL